MYFYAKNTLKNNIYHTFKQPWKHKGFISWILSYIYIYILFSHGLCALTTWIEIHFLLGSNNNRLNYTKSLELFIKMSLVSLLKTSNKQSL
jgi:hypothetical protein